VKERKIKKKGKTDKRRGKEKVGKKEGGKDR
jgi:hypothetical protein